MMKHFYLGNILLILCCIFYLAWWLIAFKPAGAVQGMKSGWLLVPAAAAGIGAIASIIKGVSGTDGALLLLPTKRVALIGLAAYVILLIFTYLLMKRPVTTELLLIVGWAVLAILEISALYAHHVYGQAAAWGFIAAVMALAALSLVCYLLYYKLDAVAGYYDGIIPLAVIGIVMAVMTVTMRLKS